MGENTLPASASVLLTEFSTLKAEQTARIGFRDNLIYVSVAAVGAVSAFALGKDGTPQAFLVIPWLLTVLGWTYLVNDEKISAIDRYIRENLGPKIGECIGISDVRLFEWEIAHRSDARRRQRKILQLLVDLITFVGSGLTSIVVYLIRCHPVVLRSAVIVAIEAGLMVGLTWQIVVYADLRSSRDQARNFHGMAPPKW